MQYPLRKQPRFWYLASIIGVLFSLAWGYFSLPNLYLAAASAVSVFLWVGVFVLWLDIARMRREIKRLRDE
jgi:hypothetical protein